MKRSLIYFLIIFFGLIVCLSWTTQSINKNLPIVENSQKVNSDSTSDFTKKIIGEWGIYVTVSYTTLKNSTRKTEQLCNSCPKIKFTDDQIATIVYPNGDKENMTWQLKDKILILVNNDKRKKERFFSDTTYNMTFTQEKGFIELELRQKNGNYSFILRR